MAQTLTITAVGGSGITPTISVAKNGRDQAVLSVVFPVIEDPLGNVDVPLFKVKIPGAPRSNQDFILDFAKLSAGEPYGLHATIDASGYCGITARVTTANYAAVSESTLTLWVQVKEI